MVKRPQLTFEKLATLVPEVRRELDAVDNIEDGARRYEIIQAAEIILKYSGYISREADLAAKQKRLENVKIPSGYNFLGIDAISTEARQKLERIRPATIGQAARIPGVSPADINILLLLLGR